MSRDAFIGELRHRMAGLPQQTVERTVEYYSELIADSVEDGMSEEEAVARLGSLEEIVANVVKDTPLSQIVQTRVQEKKAKGVSGWDLIVGKEINNRMLEGSYFNIVLIAIPLIIFLILSLRNLLPKLLSDIVIICSSLFQAWYMLGLKDSLEAKVDLLGVDGKRYFVEMDWAYNYSIVIYVMLFVGTVVLILLDTGLNLRKMIRKKEQNR